MEWGNETLMNTLSPKLQNDLLKITVRQSLDERTNLYLDGDPATRLFLVITGCVRLTKLTADGKELTLQICRPGDLVGEFGLFDENLKYTATAEVTVKSEIGVIKRSDLEALLLENGQLSVEFMKYMGLVYRRNQSKFRDLLLHGKQGALYSTLIRLTNSYGIKEEDGILIDTLLTNRELANFIGTTRESVNRMLNDLKKEGVISFENYKIKVKDIEYLRLSLECDNCPDEICRI